MYMKENTKKYGVGTWVAAILLLFIAVGLLIVQYRQMTSESVLRTEAISIARRAFGVDLVGVEFEFENTLARFKPEGDLLIKAYLDVDSVETVNEKYKRRFETEEENDILSDSWVAQILNITEEEVKQGKSTTLSGGWIRNFKFNLYSYPKGGFNIIHLQEQEDGTGTLYLLYTEGGEGETISMIWICLVPTLIILFLLAYLLYKMQREKKL